MDWFRVWHGISNDPIIRVCAKKSNVQPVVILGVWISLLEYASKNEKRGSIEGVDIESFEIMLGCSEIKKIIESFESKGMISGNRIVGWEKKQTNRDGTGRPSAEVWEKIRGRIFNRDNFTCRYCGSRGVRLECDHIIPVSRGGSHNDENLVTSCFNCNRSKRSKTPAEWGRELMPI